MTGENLPNWMSHQPAPLNLPELHHVCALEATLRGIGHGRRQTTEQARAGWVHIALSVAVGAKHAASICGVPPNRIYQHRHRMDHLRPSAEEFGYTLRPSWPSSHRSAA